MKNCFAFSIVFAVFFSPNISAQTELQPFPATQKSVAPNDAPVLKDRTNAQANDNFTVGEVRGNIQSKAVYLAKPVYSSEARKSGTEGRVRVQIIIDEEGNVTFAKIISGDPILKDAAEDAARRSKFKIARDANDKPIEVKGFLSYDFIIRKAGWSQIGFGLSSFEEHSTADFSFSTVKKAFAPEWTDELQMLGKIEQIGRATPTPAPVSPPLKFITKDTTNNSSFAIISEKQLILPAPVTAEQTALAQNLISALESRLGNSELELWQFNTGVKLNNALQFYRNPKEHLNGLRIVRQIIETAPSNAPAEMLTALQNLSAVFEQPKPQMDDWNQIGKSLTAIFNVK